VLRYEIVDVFADRPFAGNPLAVVLDGDDLDAGQMQSLAREFNLSETAFPLASDEAGVDYVLRIFTPQTELPFAGHPSVGAAWVMGRAGRVEPGVVHQRVQVGRMALHVSPDGGPVELDAGAAVCGVELDPAPLLAAVGLTAEDLDGPLPRVGSTGLPTVFLSVRPDAVARAVPDLAALGAASEQSQSWTNFALLAWNADTATAHTRVFCAGLGIPEDPATGSSATAFSAWLVASGLLPGEGEHRYTVTQGAELLRPSRIEGRLVARAGEVMSARISGSVEPVARGEIAVPPA
jgi:trans-2,3-dihydro-3-hydroxyanthranilate isomerase